MYQVQLKSETTYYFICLICKQKNVVTQHYYRFRTQTCSKCGIKLELQS